MEEGEKEASSSDALECLHDELFNLLDLICVQRKKGELQAICSLLSLPRRSKMKILNVLTSAEPESRTSSEFQEFESAKGQFEKSVLQRALFLYQPKDNDAFIEIIKNNVKQDVQRTINELFDSVQKEIQSKSQEPILDKTETESAKPQPKPPHEQMQETYNLLYDNGAYCTAVNDDTNQKYVNNIIENMNGNVDFSNILNNQDVVIKVINDFKSIHSQYL